MPERNHPDLEFLGSSSLSHLNHQQSVLYQGHWEGLLDYIRTQGKNPERNRGYSESNVRPIARRIHQVHVYAWDHGPVSTTLSPGQGDEFVEALNEDLVLNSNGEPYAEGSKRKFTQALRIYFSYREIDWEPDIRFTEEQASLGSDPFTLDERNLLLTASFDYRSPPSYSNVSPEERDRWNAHLAQVLERPKQSIGPDDWEELQKSWKIPSLISTALDCGWRAAMVGRLVTSLANIDEGRILIPSNVSVKNDEEWSAELSDRSVKMLRRWFDQRENKTKYDDSDLIWLNRNGNPYASRTLNDLLSNLIDEAGINEKGRCLTWHSIRHSTGMYVYDRHKDLGLVAEILRHSTLEAARKYAHPTPESKQDVIESIQRGGVL
jgi:integrase